MIPHPVFSPGSLARGCFPRGAIHVVAASLQDFSTLRARGQLQSMTPLPTRAANIGRGAVVHLESPEVDKGAVATRVGAVEAVRVAANPLTPPNPTPGYHLLLLLELPLHSVELCPLVDPPPQCEQAAKREGASLPNTTPHLCVRYTNSLMTARKSIASGLGDRTVCGKNPVMRAPSTSTFLHSLTVYTPGLPTTPDSTQHHTQRVKQASPTTQASQPHTDPMSR